MIGPMSAKTEAESATGFRSFIRAEVALFLGLATAGVFLAIGNAPLENITQPILLTVIFI